MLSCFTQRQSNVTLITHLSPKEWKKWLKKQSKTTTTWLKSSGFDGEDGAFALLPARDGQLKEVIWIASDIRMLSALPFALPKGDYRLDTTEWSPALAAYHWARGSYRFERYKKATKKPAKLFLAKEIAPEVNVLSQALMQLKDWINTPPSDLTPLQFAKEAQALFEPFPVKSKLYEGKTLAIEFPGTHAVGKGSAKAPCCLELTYGDPKAPRLALVGKGVSFDTGGLDIKTASGMQWMKKDMGGAAHVLALAYCVVALKLPVFLHVVVPMAENAVSGEAFLPSDILTMRNGKTVEITNTDAEGRLLLADALTKASEEKPELLIDFATLTGAARIAMGRELIPFFSNSETMQQAFMAATHESLESCWPMPLHQSYLSLLKQSPIADLTNTGPHPYGGTIVAALFLQEFLKGTPDWLHFDIMAWNATRKNGVLEGGEAMGLLSVWRYLKHRFSA